MTRRIINVKDGVNATDAANVSQLTELQEGEHISIVDSATPNEKGQTVKTISVKVDGQIKEGDTGILSGDTVYNEVHVKENGNYIRSNQTVAENLKIGEMASQLSFQRFMEFGYFGVHFSVSQSKAAKALFSSAA